MQKEPHYRLQTGLVKPDIIATKGGRRYCLDAQVVGPQVGLSLAYESKTRKYSQNRNLREALKEPGIREVHFGSLIVNISGCIALKSAELWAELGLPKPGLKIIAIRALIGTNRCFNVHTRST